MKNISTAVSLIAILLNISPVQADGNGTVESEVNKASNSTFDQRLPPVLPGEVLNDGQGKTKVWSTSGPVHGNPAPSAPVAPGTANNYQWQGGVGEVIVDQRPDLDHHRDRRNR